MRGASASAAASIWSRVAISIIVISILSFPLAGPLGPSGGAPRRHVTVVEPPQQGEQASLQVLDLGQGQPVCSAAGCLGGAERVLEHLVSELGDARCQDHGVLLSLPVSVRPTRAPEGRVAAA